MTDLPAQSSLIGLAIVVWTSIVALVVVFIAMLKRGPHR